MDIFDLNCEAIAKKDKALAGSLKAFDRDAVEVEETSSGDFTFRCFGRYFHSRYDPWKEAGLQADEILSRKFDWVILFGLGCGYLLRTLIKNGKEKILIYEPSQAILKGALNSIDLSRELALENVFLCGDVNTLIDRIRANVDGMDDIVGYQTPPYLQNFPGELYEYTNKVRNAHTTTKIAMTTGVVSYIKWIENYFANLEAFSKYPPVDLLRDKFKGLPVIVAGAGPSLNKNAHLLKGLKGRAIIIAAITAYRPLLRYGVIPDFVIASEKIDLPQCLTGGDDDGRIRLILGEVSHPNMFRKDVLGKFVFYNTYNQLSVEQAKWWGSSFFPSSGGSVTTTAFVIGCMLGCNPLIFVGQDLAFGNAGTHAPGSIHEVTGITVDREKRQVVVADGSGKQSFELLWLKGLDGSPIPSKYDWVTFHQWFEHAMRVFKEEYPDKSVINATEGGAYIEGMEHTTLQDALDRHIKTELPVEDIIASAVADRPPVDFEAILASFRRIEKSLKGVGRQAKEILKEAGSIRKEFERAGFKSELIKNVNRIKKIEDKLFKRAETVNFFWEMLSSGTFNLKSYLRDEQSGNVQEQFRKDLDASAYAYKSIENMCRKFLPVVSGGITRIEEMAHVNDGKAGG